MRKNGQNKTVHFSFVLNYCRANNDLVKTKTIINKKAETKIRRGVLTFLFIFIC